MRLRVILCAIGALIASLDFARPAQEDESRAQSRDFRPVQELLDLSGLVWLGGDRFLAVHDAKTPDEAGRVRTSLLMLPRSLEGLLWQPLSPEFPGGPSSDLEGAARIPGTDRVLLVESADDAGTFQRIFLAQVRQDRVDVSDVVEWGSFTQAFNVEGAAVAATDTGHLFIWAERNSGKQSTAINWTDLSLDPFAIGTTVSSAGFALPADLGDSEGKPLYTRPVVGIDVDEMGLIYTVAAFDPEGTVADPDNGPFRSAVFKIGQVTGGTVVLDPEASLLGTVDGLKVESIAVRELDGQTQLFIGTDDENYGGTLRRLPLPDSP